MAIRKDLGIATAYGYAVSKGYTGTEEEFAELMASYASVGQTATQAAESASASATASAGSAAQSAQSATNAQTAAEGAVQAAEQELEGYVASANQKATEAAQSATNASNSATAASTSATNAAGSATDAGTEALKAEGVTLGKQNGVDVESDSPYYHANTKYYSEQAQDVYDHAVAVKDSIPADYTALSGEVDVLKADLTKAVTNAETMADMTDTEKLYRYDGSIYYYNGTEWTEVGTSSTSELDELTLARLNATTNVETTGSPQLFDKDSYPVRDYGTSYNYYHNCYIDFTQNGKYYINPLGSAQIIKAYAYDANDTRLSLNGNASGYFGWDAYYVVERVDDTHIRVYLYASKTNFENNVVSRITDYEVGGTVAKLKFEFFRNLHFGDSMDYGIVYGKSISYYVPYGINIKYRQEMHDGIWDEFVENNKFYDIPSKCLNPWMQRSYALTDNLVDDRIFDWTKTTSSGSNIYRPMKSGEVVHVTGGKTIICSKRLYEVKTYDANGVETKLPSAISENTPYVLASDVVSIRFDVGIGINSYQIPANTYEPIYLYYADNTLYPLDDVDRNPVPMAQINGWDINKNVYDMVIPEVDSSIVRMMKTFAVRELNHQRDAFRIGTFNLYVNNTWTNRSTVKKELETYGIDVCCFQEARAVDGNNRPINIGDYLKGWQFGYCNTNADTKGNTRSLVSAYEVLSSEEVAFTANTSNSYLHCVIQLPRYKDYADGLATLSIYTYHGKVDSATTRTDEVAQILTAVARDTADFIIVTGDTNDFSANKDIWAQFNSAGLTPVHDGKSETVTERNNSLDNIFVSSNITCLYYDVINSGEWMYKPTPTSNPQPVSDHDLLYADLQFDFETVLAERNA